MNSATKNEKEKERRKKDELERKEQMNAHHLSPGSFSNRCGRK
jgi:hypothetical protein